MSADDDRNFLSRWSQRKRQVAQEAAQDAAKAANPQQQAVASGAEASAPAAPEEDFDLSLLPSLDEMTPATDLTLFFKKGVPEALRNAALRKMWAIDPAIRDYRSEALDYAYDWNVPGGVPGGGDLPADFDSSEMVARIFGDAPNDENVIGNVASQQNQILSQEKCLESPPEPQKASVEKQIFEAHQEVTLNVEESPGDAAAQKKRKHGSALPMG